MRKSVHRLSVFGDLGPSRRITFLSGDWGGSDCVPPNDLAVRTTVGKYLGDGTRLTPAQVKRALEPFAPYRGITAFCLLAYERL